MPTSTPPTVDRTAYVLPSTVGLARRLFSHLHPIAQGVNVFKMPDGTYLTDMQPGNLSNPDPSRHEWDASAPAVTYYGGHVYTITDAEASALTVAGFGSYISFGDNYLDLYTAEYP